MEGVGEWLACESMLTQTFTRSIITQQRNGQYLHITVVTLWDRSHVKHTIGHIYIFFIVVNYLDTAVHRHK